MQFIYGGAMAVSPDGHWLVFPAKGEDGVARYWLRSLDTVEARALPGTEGAFVPAAWTYDSRYVVFTPLGASATPMRLIKKVDIQGGPPQVLGEMLGALNGATSSKEGVILLGSSRLRAPVFRVPAAGGAVVPVTVVAQGDVAHRFPQFLPDGRRFLYLRISPDPDKMGVYVGSIDAGPDAQSHQRVLATNRQAYYAARAGSGQGHLVFLRDGTLMAQRFDPDRLALSGEAVSIAEGVESFAGQSYGMFSVSDTGTLAYRSGVGEKLSITWLDKKGRPEGVAERSWRVREPGGVAGCVTHRRGRGQAGRSRYLDRRRGPKHFSAIYVRSRKRRQPCVVTGWNDHRLFVEPAGTGAAVHEARRRSG